nr:acidic leucine-rich nuclear phosphoprotein 32 family member E-like [Megalopta genalis]
MREGGRVRAAGEGAGGAEQEEEEEEEEEVEDEDQNENENERGYGNGNEDEEGVETADSGKKMEAPKSTEYDRASAKGTEMCEKDWRRGLAGDRARKLEGSVEGEEEEENSWCSRNAGRW